MANRQTYTVLVPFPTGGGHWSSVGQQLELLDVEASALRAAGRLELTRVLETRQQAEPATPSTAAKKAAAKKAE
ncbi:hypothetical protein SAMN04489802_5274 [Pseudomonas chlororaphis]|uniref:hypothetical protein n=1 Tax=Pseudomonas chlororaphis TaxID=587753 RepID=UPI00087A4678|nr:hypothetical protein [Pseudomonas chlororaphis]AZD65134.1 hypothetical protein C4K17_1229 [Pseudomonas chlororaphis subsp. aurantiaca]AZD77813.1 hypothetical protein C4K15_1227 [Pseudomonas chlororaphis subsp. aurantiaca]QIT21286.1 hypothetical protein HCN09_06005 [Pseudomonas chlororaphis subsp. aurantiaca]WDH05440.1 hypothetical protein PUP57_07090 [Pseudomonas chlororaphis]WDH11805.1 hypothetical protein PUP64_07690 [Pseudomonas chlororaphis]